MLPEYPSTRVSAPQSFSKLLSELNDGDIDYEASQKLQKLVGTVAQEARKRHGTVGGELVVKMGVIIDEREQVVLRVDITDKPPKPKRPAAMGWLNAEGKIVYRDPRQGELDLQVPKRQPRVFGHVERRAGFANDNGFDPETGEVETKEEAK